MFYELGRLAVHNLMRARARLFMTAGGVLVGTTAVIMLIALTFGLQRAAEAGFGESSALTEVNVYGGYFGPRGDNEDVPELNTAAIAEFWRIEGVAAVIPFFELQSWGELRVDDYFGGGQILGIDPRLLPYLGATAEMGEMTLQLGQAIVGGIVSENFYDPTAEEYRPITVDLSPGSTLEMTIYSRDGMSKRDVDLNISASLARGTSYDYAIFLPAQQILDLNEWITGEEFDPETFTYNQVLVRATSRETAGAVAEAIREMGYNAGGMGTFLNEINSFFVTMRLVLGGVGGVALLVAAFGVANTMTMAILERTREIGLMKAVGATDRDVLTVFLIEAALVGLSGGAAGVGISYLLQNAINEAMRNMPTDQSGGGFMFFIDPSQIGGNLVIIPPELALFALALATGVGIAAGFYPALRAARMTTVVALKTE